MSLRLASPAAMSLNGPLAPQDEPEPPEQTPEEVIRESVRTVESYIYSIKDPAALLCVKSLFNALHVIIEDRKGEYRL